MWLPMWRSKKCLTCHTRSPLTPRNDYVDAQLHIPGDRQGVQLGKATTTTLEDKHGGEQKVKLRQVRRPITRLHSRVIPK